MRTICTAAPAAVAFAAADALALFPLFHDIRNGSGSRSQKAAQWLAEAGYTQVYDLGGINSWPYETE